jgi:ATP adenylyltransferase
MEYILRGRQAGCIFCKMLDSQDDRETLILHRGEQTFMVLNKYPYTTGHLMVVPYRHLDTLEALGPTEVSDLTATLILGIRALRASLRPEGLNIGANIGRVAGAGIESHFHVHVVPRWTGDANFMPIAADVRVIPQALSETYDQVRQAIDAICRQGDAVRG